MASKISTKTTFEPAKIIEPIYTGGGVSLDGSGRLLATCVEEDVLIVDIQTGAVLARIESDGEPVTSLCLSSSASHLIVSSRSLSMRIFTLSISHNPHAITADLQRTLKPHNSPVVTSTIDETDTLLATGGADGVVKVWDIRGGYVTHTFHGNGGVVSALCLFQKQISELKRRGKRKSMNDAEMALNGEPAICLASGSEDGKIRIWDLSKRKATTILDSHVSVVRSLSYSSERKMLLSASRDKTIILWDADSWKSQKVIPVLEVIESSGFISAGEFCYSGGEHGVVRIWNCTSGSEVTQEQAVGGESDAIVAIELPSNQNFVLSVHQDHTIRAHSLQPLDSLPHNSRIESLPIVKRLSGNHDEIIDLACVGPNRSLLALATNTESIRLVTMGTPAELPSGLSSHSPGFRSDQQQFGSDVALLEGHSDIIICIDVDWSGHWLATGAKDNSARLWRLDPSASSYTCFATFVGHAESIGAIALPRTCPQHYSPSIKDPLNHPPQFVLTGSQDRTIKRWETSKFKVSSSSMQEPHNGAKALYTRVAHEKDINAIDVSPTSPLFASASQDRTIKIWSLDDGSVAGILRGHKRGVWSIRFAPADTSPISLSEGGTSGSRGLLVSGSGDRTVKVWSLSTYSCMLTFEGHSNSILKVIWVSPRAPELDHNENDDSPQSSDRIFQKSQHLMIASASSDTLIKLWSPYTSAESSDHLLATLDNHTDRVWALTTHPISAFPLISGAADATVTFWKDTTSQTALEATKLASERIEQDQELQNHILARNYREVITLALQLNHPGRLLKLFEDVILSSSSTTSANADNEQTDEQTKSVNSITGSASVDEVLSSLSPSQLLLLLQRIRDWNTNARTAPVAQRILHCLLKAYPASTFIDMAKSRTKSKAENINTTTAAVTATASSKAGGGGMKDLLRALEVYTERHYKRMEELMDESFLLEYTLREMNEGMLRLGAGSGEANGEGEWRGGAVADNGDAHVDIDGVIDADDEAAHRDHDMLMT